MNLESIKWKSLNGGYKIPFDASIPLSKLEEATNEKLINSIFKDLWNNLHHQGDVGLASYYSVPRLINICIERKSYDWNFIGLCLRIEHCRQSKHNPPIPNELEQILSISYQYFLGHSNL